MWSSFTVGNVHVLFISTETDYFGAPNDITRHNNLTIDKIIPYPDCGPFGDQMAFVREDLRKAAEDPSIDWYVYMFL